MRDRRSPLRGDGSSSSSRKSSPRKKGSRRRRGESPRGPGYMSPGLAADLVYPEEPYYRPPGGFPSPGAFA